MRTVGLAGAKAQLSALLDAVEAGDEVVITRRGKAVSRLVRDRQSPRNETALPWPQRLRRFHAGDPSLAVSAVVQSLFLGDTWLLMLNLSVSGRSGNGYRSSTAHRCAVVMPCHVVGQLNAVLENGGGSLSTACIEANLPLLFSDRDYLPYVNHLGLEGFN